MKLIAAIPVLHVADTDVALQFYARVLGFKEAFRFGAYAGLTFGEVALHLAGPGDFERPVGGGTVYIICTAVDDYFTTIVARGAQPATEPNNAEYGMRDFVIYDPDGNQISFGSDIGET
jgi:uncharacterized glyoxalase superfamily protein PhnB